MAKFEQHEVDGPNNVGLFAVEDILKDSIILRETPFYSFSIENMMHYMTNENPTGNPVLDSEIRELQKQIRIANKKCSGKSASFNEEYPPQVRILLDRIVAIITEKGFELESSDVQEKWLALHDAHKNVRKGSPVGIFGLASEKGKTINGKIAYCCGYDKLKKRYIVECTKLSSINPEKLLLKRENLKTVSGVFRSNSYQEGLFEIRCRINHACIPNTKTWSIPDYNQLFGKTLISEHPNECITIAQEDIKAGEELTTSYLYVGAGKSVQARREELREKYRFECNCNACIREETA